VQKIFLRISIAASNEGIFSDKGVDLIGEFGQRIREQTKSGRDALEKRFWCRFYK